MERQFLMRMSGNILFSLYLFHCSMQDPILIAIVCNEQVCYNSI